MKPNIIIYSTDVCKYCTMAKEYFKEHGFEYTEKNVGSDVDAKKEMIEKTGQMGVPVIVINEEIIIGFDKKKIEKSLM